MDPDKLAKGMQSYVDEDPEGTGLNAIFDFMARYVRKLHSDRYIRKMLAANRGQSFLNLIGPSDVAYVICLLKNSVKVWRHEMAPPNADAPPKPLFTRGEHMKRKFGKTAWNEDGMKYYKDTLNVWKKMFSHNHDYFNLMEGAWNFWLIDLGSTMNPNGWTRKDMARLLATTKEGDMAAVEEFDGGEGGGTDAEYEYDSRMMGPR